jgi:hypothetical protein
MHRSLRRQPAFPRMTTDCALRRVESRPANSQLLQLKADSHLKSSIIADIPHGGHLHAGMRRAWSETMKLRALGAIVMLVVTGAAGLAWHMMRDQTAAAATTAGDPAVPVVADAVLSQDVPIYLTGIGAVQAFNTVTIRSRVDGQLDKVAFTEGQDESRRLLAQIDPRPLRPSSSRPRPRRSVTRRNSPTRSST